MSEAMTTTKQTESRKQIAERIVSQIAVGAWQYCSPGWVTNMIEAALKERDERAAKIAETVHDDKVFDVDLILRNEIAKAIRKDSDA